jgi:hypothetical protein
MRQSHDRDATECGRCSGGHRVDVNRPKGVERDDSFCISFLFLKLFLMKFRLLPI